MGFLSWNHQVLAKHLSLVGGFSPPLWKIWLRQLAWSFPIQTTNPITMWVAIVAWSLTSNILQVTKICEPEFPVRFGCPKTASSKNDQSVYSPKRVLTVHPHPFFYVFKFSGWFSAGGLIGPCSVDFPQRKLRWSAKRPGESLRGSLSLLPGDQWWITLGLSP